MRRSIRVIFAVTVAASAIFNCAAAAGLKPIYKVDSAAASIMGNKLVVIASGAAVTGGWSKPRLILKSGIKQENNTAVFEFVAVPPLPSTSVIQSLVPVTVSLTAKSLPANIAQIRIDAETNSTTAEIAR